MQRNQANDAQDLYDSRSDAYDDSHHPRLARHMVELARLKPGEYVLDLACGTGLVAYAASRIVGERATVTGVDISGGMLEQAKKKLPSHKVRNVSFHLHSITDLDSLDAVKNHKYNVIICCSALVLLEDPGAALKHWTSFLHDDGRLVVDVTHPMNLAAGMALERVGRRMGQPVPYYREPFQTPDDLKRMMRAAGLNNVTTTFLSIMQVPGTDDLKDYIVPDFDQPKVQAVYDVADWEKVFDEAMGGAAYKCLASTDDSRLAAKKLFEMEWTKLADGDGKVRVVDGIFVGQGWKLK